MELWLKVSLLLCMFGFFKELRPSEPFVTPYLLGPWKNFTNAEVSQLIYPFGTYSYLGLLVVVFLVTDILRYKSVIIFDGICGIVAWSLLVWAPGIPAAQLLEFFYGAFLAGEVAYYSYAYARIENRDLYARLTSHTRAACLFGRCASGVLGQSLYTTGTADLWELHIISLSCVSVAFVIAWFLPPVKHSIYFHRREGDQSFVETHSIKEVSSNHGELNASPEPSSADNHVDGSYDDIIKSSNHRLSVESSKTNGEVDKASFNIQNYDSVLDTSNNNEQPHKSQSITYFGSFFMSAFRLLWRHAYISYSDGHVVRWSAWWAISMAGFLQMLSYVQVLWQAIMDESDQEAELWNGAVEAIQTVAGALATLGVGWLRLNWEFVGEYTLAGIALIEGLVMLISATTKELWVAYLCYVIFGIFYQAMVTVASMEIAKRLQDDCYGLIFGINTFVALLLQTIWTIVIVTDAGFALGARDQFIVCGGYFLLLGLFFLVIAMVTTLKMGLRVFCKQQLWIPKSSPTSSPPS